MRDDLQQRAVNLAIHSTLPLGQAEEVVWVADKCGCDDERLMRLMEIAEATDRPKETVCRFIWARWT